MASGNSEEKPSAGLPQSGSSGGGSKVVLILSGINFIATIGMLAILFMSFQREKNHSGVEDISTHAPEKDSEHGKGKGEEGKEGESKESSSKKSGESGKMMTLDQFTVNLSTPGSVNPKFVRVNISIEVPTDDVASEVSSRMPQVRNAIIDIFNSKKPSDLATPEGRDYLKDEVRQALNSFLVNGKVKGVYFTSFALSG